MVGAEPNDRLAGVLRLQWALLDEDERRELQRVRQRRRGARRQAVETAIASGLSKSEVAAALEVSERRINQILMGDQS